jgi:hypothetical protein
MDRGENLVKVEHRGYGCCALMRPSNVASGSDSTPSCPRLRRPGDQRQCQMRHS